MGLRCRSALVWYNSLYPRIIPLSDRTCLLCAVRRGELSIFRQMFMNSYRSLDATLYHIALREYGNFAGFHESFPFVCIGTPSERSVATTWFDFQLTHGTS